MAPAPRIWGSSRACIAVSRRRAPGILAVAGFVGGRQHTNPQFPGRPRLPDVCGGARVLRFQGAAAAASSGIQCHRRCRPGHARAIGRAVHPGLHQGAGDQSAFCGAGDRARRSCTALADAGRGSAAHRHAASGTAQLPGSGGDVGAPRLPFSAAGADARLPHRAPFSAGRKPGSARRRGGGASGKGIDRHRVPECPRRPTARRASTG